MKEPLSNAGEEIPGHVDSDRPKNEDNAVYKTGGSLIQEEKPVESSIKKKLSDALQPSVLNVINESYMHSVPKGSETHFKVVVVTEKFDQLPLIKRHRMVNQILDDELKSGVHALSITAKTPKQWEDSGGKVTKSPPCQGGAGL